jgi:hypothetical protein
MRSCDYLTLIFNIDLLICFGNVTLIVNDKRQTVSRYSSSTLFVPGAIACGYIKQLIMGNGVWSATVRKVTPAPKVGWYFWGKIVNYELSVTTHCCPWQQIQNPVIELHLLAYACINLFNKQSFSWRETTCFAEADVGAIEKSKMFDSAQDRARNGTQLYIV